MNGNKGLAAGSALAAVSASIGLAVAFGVHITPQQKDAVLAFATTVIAIAPSIGAFFDHSHRSADARQTAAATIATGTEVK